MRRKRIANCARFVEARAKIAATTRGRANSRAIDQAMLMVDVMTVHRLGDGFLGSGVVPISTRGIRARTRGVMIYTNFCVCTSQTTKNRNSQEICAFGT
jgi:hypothetical protein